MRHHANTRPPLHAKRADAAHPSCTLSVRRASHSPQAHTLAAIHIVCFVRLGLLAQVGDVQTAAVATGIANTLGNKGGVALRCSVGTSSLLFINSHLTAHQHAVALAFCVHEPHFPQSVLLHHPVLVFAQAEVQHTA